MNSISVFAGRRDRGDDTLGMYDMLGDLFELIVRKSIDTIPEIGS